MADVKDEGIVPLTDSELSHLKKLHKHVYKKRGNTLKHTSKDVYIQDSGAFGIGMSADGDRYQALGCNLIAAIDNHGFKVTDFEIHKKA